MTAETLAELTHARPSGRGRWLAKCPGHADRHPSLTITQGHSGVLLKCRSAGCTPEQIVTALGLSMRDLFDEAILTPEQRQQAAKAKVIRDAEQAHQRTIDREQRDRTWKLEQLMNALGAKLARSPNDRELGRLFHEVCDRFHEVETALRHHEDGPLRSEPTPAIPLWIHDALVELGRNFDEVIGPLDAGLERIA